MDRLPERLAHNVPQRHFDSAERAHEMRAAVVKRFIEAPANQALDVAGILPEHGRRHFMDRRLRAVQLAFHGVFAVPGYPAGDSPQQSPPRRNLDGLDALNPQRALAHSPLVDEHPQ